MASINILMIYFLGFVENKVQIGAQTFILERKRNYTYFDEYPFQLERKKSYIEYYHCIHSHQLQCKARLIIRRQPDPEYTQIKPHNHDKKSGLLSIWAHQRKFP